MSTTYLEQEKNHYSYEKGIKVYYYIPSNKGKNEELPILFVLPGMERNSKSVLDNMREVAERKKIILLSPRFDPERYSPEMYNRGNIAIRSSSGQEYTMQEDSSQFTFKKFIGIFNDFVQRFGLTNNKCDIYGFSAGAQALWTFLLFGSTEDISFIDKIYPFSAGRYCYPSNEIAFPNGIKGFDTISDNDLKRFFSLNICMGVGLLDNSEETRNLPNSDFDIQFGNGRVDRAINFHTFCKNLALHKNIPFNWTELLTIPGIAHNNSTKYSLEGKLEKPGMAKYFINFYCSPSDPLHQTSKSITSSLHSIEEDDAR